MEGALQASVLKEDVDGQVRAPGEGPAWREGLGWVRERDWKGAGGCLERRHRKEESYSHCLQIVGELSRRRKRGLILSSSKIQNHNQILRR